MTTTALIALHRAFHQLSPKLGIWAEVMEKGGPLRRGGDVQSPTDATRAEVAALYARSCARLIGVLISIGGSRSEAEEVAQEAYVTALLHWSKIRTYDDPEAWVRLVAVRMLISRYRRAKVAILGLRRMAVDQRELPHRIRFLRITTVDQLIDAVRTLAIRGAPAIGTAGAFGVDLRRWHTRTRMVLTSSW